MVALVVVVLALVVYFTGTGGVPEHGSLHEPGGGDEIIVVDQSAGAPAATACDEDSERGKLVIDTTNNRLYICHGAARGWDYIALTD